jgi:hypothetical protein
VSSFEFAADKEAYAEPFGTNFTTRLHKDAEPVRVKMKPDTPLCVPYSEELLRVGPGC